MLRRLQVHGFKSLSNLDISLPVLTVLFGPNAAGKSNLLDAIQALSRIGTCRTLSDALAEPIRGRQIEAFAFGSGGLAELLKSDSVSFSIDAELTAGRDAYDYRVGVAIQPSSGTLSVRDEYLATLTKSRGVRGAPRIEIVDGKIRVRRKGEQGRPRYEPIGQGFTVLSDRRYSGTAYKPIARVREELESWRTYYLDPRVAMRQERSPSDVRDVGLLGENIAPFLFRLRSEHPGRFKSVLRTLRALIPSVGDLAIDLDPRRGTLDVTVRQGGVDFSSRIVSEGTLRVLALCAIAANPWPSSLLAFEEPENGVHPRRIELIAQLVASLALQQRRQVIVTTHSPLFCDSVLRLARERPADVALLNVRRGERATEVQSFNSQGPLFQDREIADALSAGREDGLFERMMLRGYIDE